MRRPRALVLDKQLLHGWVECQPPMGVGCLQERVVLSLVMCATASECRRLAAWLVKAADWIDHDERRSRGEG
jgi:hypothetical protein